jgi:hypothetical protein
MFRRETIIALRARHEAFRIASEIANPHVEGAPRPPEPALPIDTSDWNAIRKQVATPAMIALAVIVWLMVVLFWVVAWYTKGV